MNTHSSKIWLATAMALAGLSLSACATEGYVDEHVGAVNTRVDQVSQQVETVNGRVSALSSRVDSLDASTQAATQAAQSRADAAYKLAEGKFLMTEVSRTEVNFATNRSTLSDEAKATLTALADQLKSDNKNVYIEIRGHADMRGGKQFNRQLGRERAGTVGRFLADQGIPGNRMQAGSWGEDQPKARGRSAEALAENRRVSVVVLQ